MVHQKFSEPSKVMIKWNNLAAHKFLWYTRTILLQMKKKEIQDIFATYENL